MSQKDQLASTLGQRIRELRRKRKMTLIELSKHTDVAQATLSRMETGTMVGTVESHQKIAETLGVSLAQLYEGIDKRYSQTKHLPAAQERKVTAKPDQMKCELPTHEIAKKKITPLLVSLSGYGKSEIEQLERGVEKFIFVLDGSLKVILDKEEYNLGCEDTLYFDASIPHHLVNPAPKQARLLMTVSPSKI